MITNFLFSKPSLSEVLRRREEELVAFVRDIDAELVLATPPADLIERVVDQFRVDCPVLRTEERFTPGAKDTKVDVTGDPRRATFGPGPHYVDGTELALHIPFDGDGQIFLLQPQTWSLNPPRGDVRGKELVLTVTAAADNLNMDAVRQELDATLSRINQSLATARDQVASYNRGLPAKAEELLKRRRDKVIGDRQLEEFLAVPVGRRPNASPVLAIDIPRKTGTRPNLTVSKPFSPEPAIVAEDYEAIIGALSSFGAAAERFPNTFAPMPEPVLREILLVILNNQFGPAVGEMFSRQGKTDIAVLHDRGPVFIAECKIWSGPEDMRKAIGQLLSYLVWRDTKAAIILFIRNKDVAAVIRKAGNVIRSHDRFKREGGRVNEHSLFVLRHPEDETREITVALVTVPIPSAHSLDPLATEP